MKETRRVAARLLRLPDPDLPIFRIFPLWFFEEVLRTGRLLLVAPDRWEDPFEAPTRSIVLVDPRTTPHRTAPLESLLQPAFAQCWSRVEESDALWRAYSRVFKDSHFNRNLFPRDEGVQVRSSPRKLLAALERSELRDRGVDCFIGAVQYLPRAAIRDHLRDLLARHGPRALGRGELRAELLLFKRNAFAHEAEIRLVAVLGEQAGEDSLAFDIDPSEVFEEVTFEPRLSPAEREGREQMARSLGYRGHFKVSDLYRQADLEFVVPEGWDDS
jgi:hypothetical protein